MTAIKASEIITISSRKGLGTDMKPVVERRRCFASKTACMAIKCCPVNAVSYIEVADEPIFDKFLNCNRNDPNRAGKIPVVCDDKSCGKCGCGDNELYSWGGTPYGRIIIDYDKCTRCALCVNECCGTAIGLFPENYIVEPTRGHHKCCHYNDCC